MRIMNAIFSAVLVTAGYYITVSLMNRKWEIGLEQKGFFASSKFVHGVGAVTFLASGVLSAVRLSGFSLPLHALTLFLLWGMSSLAVTDREKQLIPNRFLLLLLMVWASIVGISVIVDTENGLALLFRSLAGGIAGGLIFLLCYLLSRKQLGAGDVKLVFVMGLYLTGQRIIGAIFYGAVLCCVYSLIQLARKKLGLRDGVALVPFLYMGLIITLFII